MRKAPETGKEIQALDFAYHTSFNKVSRYRYCLLSNHIPGTVYSPTAYQVIFNQHSCKNTSYEFVQNCSGGIMGSGDKTGKHELESLLKLGVVLGKTFLSFFCNVFSLKHC